MSFCDGMSWNVRVCMFEAAFMLIYPCAYICNNLYAKGIHGKRPMLVRSMCALNELDLPSRLLLRCWTKWKRLSYRRGKNAASSRPVEMEG